MYINKLSVTKIEAADRVNLLHTTIVPQLSKCLKFKAVWGVLTDQRI